MRIPQFLLVFCLIGVVSVPAAEPARPISATDIVVEKETTAAQLFAKIEAQFGMRLQLGVLDANAKVPESRKKPFWLILDELAIATNTRLNMNGANKTITFAAGRSATAASVDGAFRIVSNGVTAKIDSSTSATNYTIALDVQWEPRFPVYRIDAQPKVTSASDDAGHALTVRTASVKSAVIGYSHTADVRIEGLTRAAKAIAKFGGEFTITASPKMLAFAIDDFSKLPITKEIDGVKTTLAKIIKREEVWELQITVEYPTAPPNFESFESWTNRNTIRLTTPSKTQVLEVENSDISANGRFITAAYRFLHKNVDLSARKGWSVVYETPAPLVEFPIRFDLKDIKLP